MDDYSKIFSLRDKTAFVIGGNGLIGSEISKALSSFSAKVVVLDLNEKKYNQKKILFKKFDCTDLDNIEKNFNSICNEFDYPDIFVNCSYPRTDDWVGKQSFEDIALTSFNENLKIHLNSYSWLAKIAADSMKEKSLGGSIIQLGSIYGVVGQNPNAYKDTKMKFNMSYAAIKGGIINLTRQMASYYGEYNIRINTLCPGGVSDNKQDSIFKENYKNLVPLKRLAYPYEIASAALFLSSDASSYITGTTFMVDGGWTTI